MVKLKHVVLSGPNCLKIIETFKSYRKDVKIHVGFPIVYIIIPPMNYESILNTVWHLFTEIWHMTVNAGLIGICDEDEDDECSHIALEMPLIMSCHWELLDLWPKLCFAVSVFNRDCCLTRLSMYLVLHNLFDKGVFFVHFSIY